jgi:tRNA G26 N,N-dimethylase Trm1
MWLGPLFDPVLINDLRPPSESAEPRRLEKLLEVLRAESAVDRPFYYESNVLARELRLAEPPSPIAVIAELIRRGHRAAPTHAREGAFRTDAPHDRVAEVARTLGR